MVQRQLETSPPPGPWLAVLMAQNGLQLGSGKSEELVEPMLHKQLHRRESRLRVLYVVAVAVLITAPICGLLQWPVEGKAVYAGVMWLSAACALYMNPMLRGGRTGKVVIGLFAAIGVSFLVGYFTL